MSDIPESSQQPYFFTASPLKFLVMTFATLGLYEIYWFYKNWHQVRFRERSTIWPLARSIFAPIMAFVLFERINKDASEKGIEGIKQIGLVALFYFVLNLTSSLPDPLWLVSMFTFIFVLPANSVAIEINRQLTPSAQLNESFSKMNWFGILLICPLFTLLCVDLIFPSILNG